MDISHILKNYDLNNISLGVLGGHSALDVCAGAKKHGIRTVCVAKKGREATYAKHYKTRKQGNREVGCIDELIIVDDFKDIAKEEVQAKLRELNTLFVHNRYFWTYCNFKEIETSFQVPIYGTRELLKLEERDVPKNQYYLLEQSGIRIPRMFKIPEIKVEMEFNQDYFDSLHDEDPEAATFPIIRFSNKTQWVRDSHLPETNQITDIFNMDCLTLTKICNANRSYERENFVASNWEEWRQIATQKLQAGEIKFEDLEKAVIEEFILGAQINFNFFYSPITGEVELMGTDMRRQTNLDGWLRLPAKEQMKIPKEINPKHIETGHVAVTCKESLVEKAYKAAEDFLAGCKKEGFEIIGPFALQGAIETDGKKEELVVFDVSFRIPGSPGISATPYTGYLHGYNISMGERIAIEIKEAQALGQLPRLLT